jgi:AcrR family transcriptional regulator
MIDNAAGRTRERILAIAGELFGRQGYAGTSIADISSRLGTSKAAIYYHFASKKEILDAIIASPLSDYTAIAERARQGAPPEELLGALIDLMAGPGAGFVIFGDDPSTRFTVDEHVRSRDLVQKTNDILVALSGPNSSAASRIRACAAFGVAKEGTRMSLWINDGVLRATGRSEVLAAALRALAPGAPGGGSGDATS